MLHGCFSLKQFASTECFALSYMITILGLQTHFGKPCLSYLGVKYSFPVPKIYKMMSKERESITLLSKYCVVYLLTMTHSSWNNYHLWTFISTAQYRIA